MLKKSLKAGSIIVLLLSLLFFIGCSNAASDANPNTDTPQGPVNPPDNPQTPVTPADPRVTRVTILPGNVEVPRNGTYTFTARVEGSGNYDDKVTFSLVNPADGEGAYMAGTKITGAGRLTVDLGEEVGRIIRVQAVSVADPTVRGTVEASVAPTGPYFTWEPSFFEVPQDAVVGTPVVSGFLRGYSRQDIDIRIRAGILEEGVDYTIAPENLVGNRGTIVVTGTDRHFDEVTIGINAAQIRLIDPTKKGYIKINLEQAALFGADKDMVKANRLTLTLEVVDYRVITALETTEFDYDTGARPIQGAEAPLEFTAGFPVAAYGLVSINWDTLTYNGLFYKTTDASGAVIPVNATVKLRAAAGRYFLGSIGAADIVNDTSFLDNPLAVKDITVSPDGKDLEFTLEYNVFALTITKISPALGTVDINDVDTITPASFGLRDFPFTQAGIPSHHDPLPATSVILNSYYEIEGTVDKVWSGAVEWADADKTSGTFKGVKGTPKARATATIALKPKIGYTFDGTDLDALDFVDTSSKPYNSTANIVGKTLTSGPDGSLILTIVYEINEKVIVLDDLVPANFETLIARPIHGKPVRVGGLYAASTAFTATADSPYVGTVSWEQGTAPYALQKFDNSASSTATITLKSKPGYVFDASGTPYNDAAIVSKAVAVDGPVATGTFNVGTDVETLAFTLVYAPAVVKQQITSLDGLSHTDIDPIPDTSLADETSILGGGSLSPIATGSGTDNIEPLSGVASGGGKEFIRGVNATVKVALLPQTTPPYTFSADDGPLPYLTYNVPLAADDTEGNRIKTLIEDHFSEVYKGTTVGTMEGTKVTGRVESMEAPYLDVWGNLVLTLKFPPKPEVIDEDAFTLSVLGDLPDDEPKNGDERAVALDGITTTAPFSVSPITWTTNDPDDEGKFVSTFEYTATFTLTPKTNFTFIDSPISDIVTKLLDNAVWGSSSAGTIKLSAGAITVTGVSVEPDEDLIPTERDKLVITLKWTI
jgi:hypothetical protein